jgi:hypothetical protein
MTYATPSVKTTADLVKGHFLQEIAFASKAYALAAVGAVAISFGSALLGYPLVTFHAPPSVEAPTPAPPTAIPPTPIDTTPAIPNADPAGALVASPSPQDFIELKSLLLKQAKEAGEPKLAEEPKIGDTVPKWVQLKPLTSDVEPRLKWMGFVDKNARATAIFLHVDDVFIVNPANQVVGVVPLREQARPKPQ